MTRSERTLETTLTPLSETAYRLETPKEMSKNELQVIPSENYPSDELERLLAEIRSSGIAVTRGGIYGRRSRKNLPPVLWLIASFAAGAVGTGFLNAMGADAWEALKKAIQQTRDRQGRSVAPTITLSSNSKIVRSSCGPFPMQTTLQLRSIRL